MKPGDPVTIGVDGRQAQIVAISGTIARVRTEEGLLEEIPVENLEPPHPTETLDTADGTIAGE